MLNSRRSSDHTLFGHHGTIRMISTGSSLILAKTFGIRGNRGKAYTHIPFHEMDMASVAHAISSGYGDTEIGKLKLYFVAKRLMCGLPPRAQIDSTTLGCRDHSVPITGD